MPSRCQGISLNAAAPNILQRNKQHLIAAGLDIVLLMTMMHILDVKLDDLTRRVVAVETTVSNVTPGANARLSVLEESQRAQDKRAEDMRLELNRRFDQQDQQLQELRLLIINHDLRIKRKAD